MRLDCLVILTASALLAGCAVHQTADYYPYHDPLISPGAKLGAMPPAVVNAIRAEAGPAEIYDIRKFHHNGRPIYEILFSDSALYPPLYIESDGSVVYPDLATVAVSAQDTIGPSSGGPSAGIKFSDLPINVAKTVHDHAPDAEVGFINKFSLGDHAFYEIAFKDSSRPRMIVTDDGTVVQKMLK